jgi:hypothetical protein
MDLYFSAPLANKVLNPDGSETTFAGEPVSPASAFGAEQYRSMAPIANKVLNPDGSVVRFEDVIPADQPKEPEIIFSEYSAFPEQGEANKLYIAEERDSIYRWDAGSGGYKRVGLGLGGDGGTLILRSGSNA